MHCTVNIRALHRAYKNLREYVAASEAAEEPAHYVGDADSLQLPAQAQQERLQYCNGEGISLLN